MAKALKAFIVILLLLSIASLVLGIMLFSKREVLKARTQKNEAALAKISQNLRFDGFNAAELVAQDEVGLAAMDAPLSRLSAAADNQYNELQLTKEDLARTQTELATTKDELTATQGELTRTQEQVQQLNATVTAKNAEIATKEDTIASLEQEKATQQTQIDELNNKIATMEDEKQDLNDKVVTLEQTIVDLEALKGESIGRPLPRGISGKIMLVNKDWNFVVLNLGSKDGLVPNAEMLVHRGDKLVGKIQISGVAKEMAIADINSSWSVSQVREGDFVAAQ